MNNIRFRATAALAGFLLSTATLSAGQPAMVFNTYDDRRDLLVYDAEFCDEEVSIECPLAGLVCDADGQFKIIIADVGNVALAKWLLDTEWSLGLTVSGITAGTSFYPEAIYMNDMNGTWDVDFRWSPERPFQIVADTLSFETIAGKVSVPLMGNNRAQLDAFIAACDLK